MCVDVFYLKQSCFLCVSSKRETSTGTKPLQQAAPRLPTTRYHLPSKPCKRMLEIIEQLFGMFAVIGALYVLSQMMLVAESSDDMMMFTALQQAALNVFLYQVLNLLEDAVRMYYQHIIKIQTSEPSIESGSPSVFAMNGVSTMYNNFLVLFTFPTVYVQTQHRWTSTGLCSVLEFTGVLEQ